MPSRRDAGGAHNEGWLRPPTSVPGMRLFPAALHSQWDAEDWAHSTATITLAQVPKEEWEGATLRNSQTKCNSLYPMEAPASSDEAYSQARGGVRPRASARLHLRGFVAARGSSEGIGRFGATRGRAFA